jgi:hypothetical protein
MRVIMTQPSTVDSPTGALTRADEGRGSIAAAIMASAVGAVALGTLVLLNELELFTSPILFEPAGGLSGRSTLAVVVWLLAWVGLNRMWRGKYLDFGQVLRVSLILIGLSLLALLPAVWHLLGA